MDFWIDCEWNDFRGKLISMALCAEDGRDFYGVMDPSYYGLPSQWIAENVIPKLVVPDEQHLSVHYELFERNLSVRLMKYLLYYEREPIRIIADWPEDIQHFCAALIMDAGVSVLTRRISCVIAMGGFTDAVSENPHNALADARANRVIGLKEAT